MPFRAVQLALEGYQGDFADRTVMLLRMPLQALVQTIRNILDLEACHSRIMA
jgi:hypothetical protein